MKRTLCIILLVIMSIMTSACGSSVQENTVQENSNTYPDTGLVYEVDEKENTVSYICQNGNCFSFYGIEDWCVGDLVSVIMDDNGTPEVADDIILDARYSGWYGYDVDEWVKVN